MGIKKLSWKKLWKVALGAILLVGLISGILGIANNWDTVSNWLSTIGNFFIKIFTPVGRDVLLFVLIIGILFWLFRRSRKTRNVPQAERIEEKEEWQFDWNLKHEFVLKKIADGPKPNRALYKLYEKEFSDASKLEFKVIMDDLREADLIRFSHHMFKKKYYEATRKGREYALKGLLKEMEMKRIASRF